LAARAFDSSQTSFAGDPVDSYGEQTNFPKSRPKGVSADEWKALNASSIDGAAETGRTSYALLDLDNDGQRDLIVDTYAGGTGLFTYVETWRRAGGLSKDRSSRKVRCSTLTTVAPIRQSAGSSFTTGFMPPTETAPTVSTTCICSIR